MVRERRWWSIPRMPPPPAWWKRRDVSPEPRAEAASGSAIAGSSAAGSERRSGTVVISAPLEAKAMDTATTVATPALPCVPEVDANGETAATTQDECIPSISFSFFSEAEQLFSSTLPSTVLKEEMELKEDIDEKNEQAEADQKDADEVKSEQTEALKDPLEINQDITAEVSESLRESGPTQPGKEYAECDSTTPIEQDTMSCSAVLLPGSDSSDHKEGEIRPISPQSPAEPLSLSEHQELVTLSPPLSPREPSSRPRTPPRPGPSCLSLSPSTSPSLTPSRLPLSSPPSSPPPPPPTHPPPPPPFPSPPSDATMQVRRSMGDVTLGSNDSNGGYEVLRIRAISPSSAPDTFPSLNTEDVMRRLSSEPPQYASPRVSYIQDCSVVTSRETTCSPLGWKCVEPYSLSDSYLCYEMPVSVPTNSGSAPCSEAQSSREYEDLEYCAVRAGQRRATLLRGAGGGRALAGGATVRVGRAWRALRGWWRVERSRITHAVQRHARAAQALAAEAAAAAAAATATATPAEETEDATTVAASSSPPSPTPQPPPPPGPRVPPGMVLRRRREDTRNRPVSRAGLVRSRYIPEGQNGFEELRRYIKQGGDFCKDLTSILQERSEAENQYAKTLSKLSCKLLKASKDSVGSVNQAWQRAGAQMEAQSEAHRAFAAALSEEVVKPLRQLIESQHRIRKSVESVVDKTAKSLTEWRTAEAKSKKQSFLSARENEKLQDVTLDVRLGRNTGSAHAIHNNHKQVSDKECAKLESKRRKAEEHVKKSDVEYYTFCIRAERARLEWETAVIRGSHCFQALEEERLQQLKDLAACYLHHLQDMGPKLIQSTEKLVEPVQNCDIANDIQTVVSIKGTGQPIPEQLLPDFYAEHITLAMNRERRRQALVKILQLIRQDLERERRGKQGVESLARALQQTPNFGAEDSQQNLSEKLHHMRSMLTYLEAARYKVHSALVEIDGRTRGSHPLAPHIQVTRDKQGLQQSVLKVPPWVRKESLDQLASDSPDWTDRGAGDGNSVQPDSDFDEFSSQGSEKDYQSSVMTYPVISECNETPQSTRSQCRALYEYAANLYDELNLRPGDIINIHNKQADGWWLGELNGVVGIFPATYVEEM